MTKQFSRVGKTVPANLSKYNHQFSKVGSRGTSNFSMSRTIGFTGGKI